MLSTGPQLAQPPTSLLSLPNDILLLIYEEIHTARCQTIGSISPLRIDELLVNKRIFSLARPLWYRHLSISESQLDQRLGGLNKDQLRCASLRSLDIVLNNTFVIVLESILLRVPQLTYLSIFIADGATKEGGKILVDAIRSLGSLRCLTLRTAQSGKLLGWMPEQLTDNWSGAPPRISLDSNGFTYFVESRDPATDLTCASYRWSSGLSESLFQFDWSKVISLDLQARDAILPFSDSLLGGLKEAIEGKEEVSPSLRLTKYLAHPYVVQASTVSSDVTPQTLKARSPARCPYRFKLAQVLQAERFRLALIATPTDEA